MSGLPSERALVAVAMPSTVMPHITKKLVVVGDGGVGKTALLCAIAHGKFPVYTPSIFESFVDEFTIDGQLVHYELWDTSGQDEYARLRPLAYPRSNVVLIAFSLSDRVTLDHVGSNWIKEIREYCGTKIPVILVGCKSDLLPDDARHPDSAFNPCPWVTRDKAERVAYFIGAHAYVECSALKSRGLRELYEVATAAGMLMKKGVLGYERERKRGCVVC